MIWLASLISLLAGIALGVCIPWFKHPHVSSTIEVGNIFNVIASLIVAFAINVIYARQTEAKSSEVKLLNGHVRDVHAAIRKLNDLAAHCSDAAVIAESQRASLIVAERELSNEIHSLEHALECCGKRARNIRLTTLKRARTTQKKALTDLPYDRPLRPDELSRIHRTFKTLKDECTRLTFAISRI